MHGSRLLAALNTGRSPTVADAWPGLTQRAALVDCHQRGAARRWRACHGAHLVDTVAELMGQGNARVTPVGVASQWLGLARLASGQPNKSMPFLAWDPAQGLPGTPADAARRPAAGSAAARAARDAWLTDCRLSPIKWWAAAIGDGQGWHKVVVAVAERNWQADGWIDDRRDLGPHVAAEAGLAYVQARWARSRTPPHPNAETRP